MTDDDLSLHSCAQSFDSDDATATEFIVAKQEFKPTVPKYETLRPFLGWVNSNRVRETLRNTTQHYRPDSRETLRRHFKTRFPAANVNRINETVCTDTLFSDTPAHNDGIPGHGGATMAQLYVGRSSGHTKLYPMKTESQMHQTLEDYIRDEGAPNLLFSDNAKTQTGFKVARHPPSLQDQRFSVRTAPTEPELRRTPHWGAEGSHQPSDGSHEHPSEVLAPLCFVPC